MSFDYLTLKKGAKVPTGAFELTIEQIKALISSKELRIIMIPVVATVEETVVPNNTNTQNNNKSKKEVANKKVNNPNNSETTTNTCSSEVNSNEPENLKAQPSLKEKADGKKAKGKPMKKSPKWCTNGWECNKKDSGCIFKHKEGRLATCRTKNCDGQCGLYHKKPKQGKKNATTNAADDSSSESDSDDDDDNISVASSSKNSTNNSGAN
jgi:hypothetical protein